MNILILYNSSQTYTNAVYEHLANFASYSEHRIFFAHCDETSHININLNLFDAVCIHFSIRLPFDQISSSLEQAFMAFRGLKFLFIQDEYDFTKRAWYWINKLGIQLVFTCVPFDGIETVYPKLEFPHTRFVSNLTGYVPELLPPVDSLTMPSERSLVIGYRGRPLPVRYGQLGIDKVRIGRTVKLYCDHNSIDSDISWSERDRIYGQAWYEFVASCRAMLGTESGSNVFDWDGDLQSKIVNYTKTHIQPTNREIYENVVRPMEINGLMNQVSPRIFEAIASRTVLVLYEGKYSSIIRPYEHFIPLKRDGSNLDEVFGLLNNDSFVDSMSESAFQDVIASGKYSYSLYSKMLDDELNTSLSLLDAFPAPLLFSKDASPSVITSFPIRTPLAALIPSPTTLVNTFLYAQNIKNLVRRLFVYSWLHLPKSAHLFLKPILLPYMKNFI